MKRVKLNFYKVVIFICAATLVNSVNAQKKINVSNKYVHGKELEETVLAKVGDKTITVKEFYERAEYTIRPQYCKGNSNIDKKIILNSLIAEKLLALELGSNSSINRHKEFNQILKGRKEQIMRQLLFHEEGYDKVKIDSTEFVKEYKAAGRTYNVEFINFDDLDEAKYVLEQLKSDTVSFAQAYHELTGKNKVPNHKIVWNSSEYKEISNLLFKSDVKINQIFGPIKLPESYLLFKVKGWIDKPAITESEQSLRYNNVNDKLRIENGVSEYVKFVKKIMAGKELRFNKSTFKKLVKIMAPLFTKSTDNTKEDFAVRNLNKKNELDKTYIKFENDVKTILDDPLFVIDGKIWTVRMYEAEREVHPLVFRTRPIGDKKFALQLKYAIVDLIQDKYLTKEAYKRNLDKAFITKRITNMWSDALISFYEQIQIIKEKNITDFFSYETIDKIFKPCIDELQKKYSNVIEVNIEEIKKIKLTRIDFIALQENVPYPIIVPSFPQITTDYNLDYGKKMNEEKK